MQDIKLSKTKSSNTDEVSKKKTLESKFNLIYKKTKS